VTKSPFAPQPHGAEFLSGPSSLRDLVLAVGSSSATVQPLRQRPMVTKIGILFRHRMDVASLVDLWGGR